MGTPSYATGTTCLALMFKAPSRSKQRLAAQLGPLARVVAERLFACAREDAAAWRGPVCYAPAEDSDADWLEQEVGLHEVVVVQRGVNLGARINYVERVLRVRGFERQIYIGIDCPELTMPYIEAARAGLERSDLVVGPATDGGAVLIGTRGALPDLEPLPWSTERLEQSLVELAHSQGLSVHELVPLGDVDTLEDLRAVTARLRGDARPGRRAFCAALGPVVFETSVVP